MVGFFLRRKLNKVTAAAMAIAIGLSSRNMAQAQTAPQAQMQLSLSKKQQLKRFKVEGTKNIEYLFKNREKVDRAIFELGLLTTTDLYGGTKRQRMFIYDYIETMEQFLKLIDELESIIPEEKLNELREMVVQYTKLIDSDLFNTVKKIGTATAIRAIALQASHRVEAAGAVLQINLALLKQLYQRVLQSGISFPLSTESLLETIEEIESTVKKNK